MKNSSKGTTISTVRSKPFSDLVSTHVYFDFLLLFNPD